jgi:hypothetical protein
VIIFKSDIPIAERMERMQEIIADLFRRNRHTHFETGMDSDFSRELSYWIQDWYGHVALWHIANEFANARSDLAAETIVVLGRVAEENSQVRYVALLIIISGLHSPHYEVRDEAAQRISHIGDIRLAGILKQAVEREKIPSLRANMQAELDALLEEGK